MNKLLLPALFVAIFTMVPAHAEELNYNLYQLQASASQDIANDLMVVTLAATHQATTAKEASYKVNQDMEWALDQIESDDLDARTEQYSTYPQYRSEKIVSWNVSQNLRLESDNFELLTDLVGDLQERLQVKSMTFSVKPETRETVENELIAEALGAYRHRAGIVVQSMQASGYDMVNTNINTQNHYSPVYARAEASSFKSVSAAPAVEAGESQITVNVNGQIQLDF